MKIVVKHRRAMALVLVLASLVFLAALAVAFLLSSRVELKSSKTYADSGRAHLMAQTAVNLCISQITEATKGVDASGSTLAWASQPGMIRTYDENGNPASYFKLYSWDVMTGAGAFNPYSQLEQPPANWADEKATYTDLNEPLQRGASTARKEYPIIDGNNLVSNGGKTTYENGEIEGFHITDQAPLASGSDANPVPMPVKWIYVLQDGKLAAPSSSAGNTATFTGPNTPTANNPIVGRVAFWTDDETSKVNLNTASEGTYWDTPRTSRPEDGVELADKQPAQHEYQRYPGHPATTSLSAVFPNLTAEQIYDIVPRIKGGTGTSLGGTVRGSQVITPDSDRFYATTDELVFRQPSSGSTLRSDNDSTVINKDTLNRARFFLTATSRAPDVNLFNKPRVCIWPIHLNDASTHRTPFDQLIAFCSTVGGQPFYFQRSSPLHPTDDLPSNSSNNGLNRNRKLLDYLSDLTSQPIPGFGGSFLAKYPSPGPDPLTGLAYPSDRNQILTQIFDYIRATNLTDTSTPGLTPFTSLGSNNSITSGTGLVTPIEPGDGTRGFGRYPTIKGASLVFYGIMDDDNPPTAPRATGGNPIKAPDGLVMIRAFFIPQLFMPAHGYIWYGHRYFLRVRGLNTFQWEGVDANGNSTGLKSMGFPATAYVNMGHRPYMLYGEVGFGGVLGDMQAMVGRKWQNMTSTDAYPLLTSNAGLPALPSNPANPPVPDAGSLYVRKDSTFKFKGGDVSIDIISPPNQAASFAVPITAATVNSWNVVQTITLRFPSVGDEDPIEFPSPAEAPVTSRSDYRRLVKSDSTPEVRLAGVDAQNESGWIRAEDVVRSVVPAVGDIRLIAARKNISPQSNDYAILFAPHSKYFSGERHAHNMRHSKNGPYYGATGGRLVPVNYHNSASQYFTSLSGLYIDTNIPEDSGVVPDTFTNGVALGKNATASSGDLPGDWDNGVSHTPDGPYINKPDEGDASFSSSAGAYYYWVDNPVGTTVFSPNRMIPSAGMFGSLPSGVWSGRPWQTLHFRPGPIGHPGLTSPKDHLLLDLFHMPVVEPYAVSEPLSTAGRINMNYQIVPFTYINRDTGIRAVLKSEKMLVIPENQASSYKRHQARSVTGQQLRLRIDPDETLVGFRQRFAGGDIFRSASEICDIHLVPEGSDYGNMETFWNDKRLTGDNSREKPYATIYPRLTTKSNTFTIHFRAQALKKVDRANPARWNEAVDQVTGEYRGSQTVERYVDPNGAGVPDYADPSATPPIGSLYKYRILQAKRFTP